MIRDDLIEVSAVIDFPTHMVTMNEIKHELARRLAEALCEKVGFHVAFKRDGYTTYKMSVWAERKEE